MAFFDFLRSRRDLTFSALNQRRVAQDLERYGRIFKGSHGYGFLDWDLEARFISWDGGFWAFLGYENRDMKKISNPDEFLDLVHPDDRDLLQNLVARHVKMNGPGEAIFRIRKKLGGYIWAEVRTEAQRIENGYVQYTSGVIFDVTKLKEIEEALLTSEARHSRILKASNDGVWEWTAEHGSFHFSSRCWEQLGYDEGDDDVTRGIDRLEVWRQRIHPDDLVKFDKTLNDHFIKKSAFDVEYRIKGKHEQWCWIRARGQMHYSADGRPWRMSGTNMDITELKRAEEGVIKAKEDAEKANRAKSEFLSSMSHELRTPLNAILGFAQLFDLDTNLTPDQRENINEIRKGGEHLLGLVGDVLDLAKIESGLMTILPERIVPLDLIKDCLSLVQTQADARGIKIEVNSAIPDDKHVFADKRRTKQVLLNLLSNAVKYNYEKGSVKINLRQIDDRACQITVSDSGRGISEEFQASVFQPFNRLDAESSQVEGTGVGLVISKRLVEQMNGAMGFSSVERQGSTFWFQLPLATETDIQNGYEVAKQNNSDRSAGIVDELQLDFNTYKKVLYVEDSIPNQRLMQQILRRYPQIKLTVVPEGFSGLFEARANRPDLIIMDINLPGMSGYETLDILRRDQETASIPVIALSANAMPHDVEKGKDAGFAYYLTKPLDLSELIKVFNDLLK